MKVISVWGNEGIGQRSALGMCIVIGVICSDVLSIAADEPAELTVCARNSPLRGNRGAWRRA